MYRFKGRQYMISGVDISVGDDLGRLLIVISFVCSLPRLRQCAEMAFKNQSKHLKKKKKKRKTTFLRIKWQLQTFFFCCWSLPSNLGQTKRDGSLFFFQTHVSLCRKLLFSIQCIRWLAIPLSLYR
jgi:hypothetical protein